MPPQGRGGMLLTPAEERRLQEEGDLLKPFTNGGGGDEEAGNGHGQRQQQEQGRGQRQQRQRQQQRRGLRWPPPFRSNSGSTAPMDEDEEDEEDEEDGTDNNNNSMPPPRRLQPAGASFSSYLSPAGPSRLRRLLPALLLFLAVAVLLATGGVLLAVYHGKLLGVSQWMQARAPVSAVYFTFFMALWVTLCLPSTPVELTAGFIFGFPLAFAALAVGKPLGCCIAFLLGRCIAADSLRDGLLKRAHGEGPDASRRARALFLAMERHPWKMTLLLRFMFFPIAFKNYGVACLPCPFHVFAICTFLAGLPFTLLWAHMGASSRSLLDVVEGHRGKGGLLWEVGVIVAGLLFAILLALLLRHYTLKYMRRLAEEEEDLSEREAAAEAEAAAAAQAAHDGETGGAAAAEALLRMPLRAGAPPPTYGAREAASSSSRSRASPAALPFLKWPAAQDKTNNSSISIGLSPLSSSPHPDFVTRAAASSPPPPRLPSPGPGGVDPGNGNGNGVGARLV